jgi:hypothetical protein
MAIDWSRDLVLRWNGDAPFPEELARIAGVDAVVKDPPEAALTRGLWPGVRQPQNVRRTADDISSASSEPWVDSNAWLVAFQRAIEGRRVPVLAYEPKLEDRMVGFETLETALVEARVMGGNFLLTLEPRYERSLLAGEDRAVAAWKRLGKTAKWLKQNARLLGRPAPPIITVLAEPGSAEIVNLLFRRGASPRVVSSREPPQHSGEMKALVAASLRPPSREVGDRILAYAAAGGTVVMDGTWWQPAGKPVLRQKDRDFFAAGRGTVVLYKKRVVDPSEFALDVIDLITHRQRAIRIWNAAAVVPVAGQATAYLINYGGPIAEQEIQVRFQGHFRKAAVFRPDAAPLALDPKVRGSMTEVFVRGLDRIAVVEFS